MLDDILRAMQQKYLAQFLITIAIILTICTLYLSDRPVPQELLVIGSMVLAFHFGTISAIQDVSNTNNRIQKSISDEVELNQP